jgi:DNA adenine methylase
VINNSNKISPVVKWAGGKTKVYSQLIQKMPKELFNGKIKNYYEPFFGGGAIFFNIIQFVKFDKCILSDINEELMLLYSVIKNDINKLIGFVEKYQLQYDSLTELDKEKYYYDMRNTYNIERFNINHNDYSYLFIPRAAQMLFLNKTCYNGLYRQNLRGEFNVPFGKNYHPRIIDHKNLISIGDILKNVEIKCKDFQDICLDINEKNSFVYLDPPYRSINKSVGFTNYHKSNFTDKDQFRLSETFKILDEKKIKLMLNNSCMKINDSSGTIEKYYNGYNISYINSNSTMSSVIAKRKKINELVITNY